jgi:hypothetical protein
LTTERMELGGSLVSVKPSADAGGVDEVR